MGDSDHKGNCEASFDFCSGWRLDNNWASAYADSLSDSAKTWGDIIGSEPDSHPNLDDPETQLNIKSNAVSSGYLDKTDLDRYVLIATEEAKKARRALQIAPSVNPDVKNLVTTTPELAITAAAIPAPEHLPSTNVVPTITSNRWTSDALIVAGTLTNTSTVPVLITGIDAKGFNQDQKFVARGSDFTVLHNDLAPGEAVNFKVALKDGAKTGQVRKVGTVLVTMNRRLDSGALKSAFETT